MKEGRKPEYSEKTPNDEFQKWIINHKLHEHSLHFVISII